MNLHIINSNSMGNAYILESSTGEALLLECGVKFQTIKEALKFKLSRVSGCLLTHEHGDHAKAVDDVLKAGIKVYSSAGTHRALGITDHHRAIAVKNEVIFSVGSFLVIPFNVKHDVEEPFGYLIQHPECGTVLFLTDSYYCEYKFPGLNNIIIEANYSQEILDERMARGVNPKFLRDRVITSHMSLATCKKTLASYDLSAVNNIVLIHLSDSNSNEKQFREEVQQLTGKTVTVARPGLTIPFNKTAF